MLLAGSETSISILRAPLDEEFCALRGPNAIASGEGATSRLTQRRLPFRALSIVPGSQA
jgi:hypothetical protein